jgi:hypothetical protein
VDSQSLTLIATVISTPVVMRLVEGWLNSRNSSEATAASRLDKLEAQLNQERVKTEETQAKLFEIAVKHEGLKVRFELLESELRKCKEQNHGLSEVSHAG